MVLVVGACGKVVGDLPFDSGTSAPIADARPADGGPQVPQTIRGLRTFVPAPLNQTVLVKNVVVLGHVTFENRGEIWVQDMGVMGPDSAIKLVCGYGPNCNLSADQIDKMPVGLLLPTVRGQYGMSQATISEPQISQIQVPLPDPPSILPLAIETVPASMVRHNNLTPPPPDVVSRLGTYVRVDGPIRIVDVTPVMFQDVCPRPLPDGGMETMYRGTMAEAAGQVLALQLGVTNAYCRPQCSQTCTRVVMNGDTLTSVAGVLTIVARDPLELVIRPSRDIDVAFP